MKKNVVFLSVCLGIILLLGIGVSYSLWNISISQDSTSVVTTKCFNVEITSQKNNISLENAYPISNENGKKLTPFSFTITNTCDIFASYTVNLESLKGSNLSSKFLNAMINNEEIKRLSDYETTDVVNNGSIESHTLARGSLGSGDSEDYTLRIWIDYDTTMEDLNNEIKTFKSKIVVKAQPSNWSPVDEGYITLHDAILANEYQTSPDTAIKKIDAKGTPDFSKTAPLIEWKEDKEGKISSVSIRKISDNVINQNEIASDLKNDFLLLATDYHFDKDSGYYYLDNINSYDVSSMDFENSEIKYYVVGQSIGYNQDRNKFYNWSTNKAAVLNEAVDISKNYTIETWNDGNEYETSKYTIKVKSYSIIENQSDKSDKGLFVTRDDYGNSYYYRGNVKNNNLLFNNMYWKIIRINGDGSIRLIYNGDNVSQKDNKSYINISYFNSNLNSDYATLDSSTQALKESDIKLKLDNWFQNNFDSYKINNYIADAGYCNDRSTDEAGTYLANTRNKNNSPQLFCNNSSNDLFTVTNTKGNSLLKYSVGLITYDELKLAGISSDTFNKSSWVQDNYSYWTITPKNSSENFFFSANGLISNWSTKTNYAIRPVINLKAGVEISGGIGTINDPFVVE